MSRKDICISPKYIKMDPKGWHIYILQQNKHTPAMRLLAFEDSVFFITSTFPQLSNS